MREPNAVVYLMLAPQTASLTDLVDKTQPYAKKMLKDANLEEDAYLQPSDFLYVPQNGISKIQRFIPSSSMGMYANPMLH